MADYNYTEYFEKEVIRRRGRALKAEKSWKASSWTTTPKAGYGPS